MTPDKSDERQISNPAESDPLGTSEQHQVPLMRDLSQPLYDETEESKHNVSFCGKEDLFESVTTRLFLHQFN